VRSKPMRSRQRDTQNESELEFAVGWLGRCPARLRRSGR
jgi:hypothetical protein